MYFNHNTKTCLPTSSFRPSYICFCLGTEMLTKSARLFYSLVGHSLGYGAGYILLSLLAYFIRSWRMLMVASAIPSLLFIPTWW